MKDVRLGNWALRLSLCLLLFFLTTQNPKDSVAVVALGDDEEEVEEGCGKGGQEEDGEGVEPVGDQDGEEA